MADYEKMWEELGMNMELHDQLCQVLPTAFGDVYLSQENRPEGMGFWDFVASGLLSLSRLKRTVRRYLVPSVCMYLMRWSLQPRV